MCCVTVIVNVLGNDFTTYTAEKLSFQDAKAACQRNEKVLATVCTENELLELRWE